MSRFFAIALCTLLAACAGSPPPAAPQPKKPIDPAAFFHGRWYEIARTPISLTTNCVAGTTDFFTTTYNQLIERDECRKGGTPEGPIQSFQGAVFVDNPGQNTKFTVHYVIFGVLPIQQTYWVLDHADDYSWMIVSDPAFDHVDILARAPRSPKAEVAALTAKVAALGYDTAKLEYPPTFPPGEH
jgi:apolipoprotein D and lipocalin family protein